ncbi:MAG: transcriptional regulator, ArsR family [Actinomycetia bacterium]|nr:transcriptional regulator, ArsR family [Actinomycetes bacterium]
MSATTDTLKIYEVSIKVTPEALWDAITTPEWTVKYGYGTTATYDLRPGGSYRGVGVAGEGDFLVVEGEVLEVDPPHRLVQTYHLVFDPSLNADPFTRVTWEIDDLGDGTCRLRVTHDVTGAPATALSTSGGTPQFGGGWPMILDSLKALLEG